MEQFNNIDDFWKEEILRFLKGELTYDSEVAFKEWLNESIEHIALFEQYRTIWLLRNQQISNNIHFNEDSAWDKLHKKRGATQIINKKLTINKYFKIKQYLKVAAIFTFVFSLGGVISFLVFSKKQILDNSICQIVTPLGAKSQVTLPDGTEIWLNAGTKLTYTRSFGITNRKIYLEGEAFCKVKSDKKNPFIVQTSLVKVTALGTSFNVKAYPDDIIVSTTLVDGIVKIEGTNSNNADFSYTLKANQNLIITKPEHRDLHQDIKRSEKELVKANPIKPILRSVIFRDSFNTELNTSWKEKRWQLQGEPLYYLSKSLERRYNVIIRFKSEEIKNYRFTGIVENETLEQFMEILSLTTPLRYTIGKGEIWWDIDPKLKAKYQNILQKK